MTDAAAAAGDDAESGTCVVADRDWDLRPYNADTDEGGMMYFLGVGYTRSRAGWRAGASGAGERRGTTPDTTALTRQRAFLDACAPIWSWLLEHADVTLAVDPLDPVDSIWGWIVTSKPNVVHALGCKRSVIKAGLGKDIIMDLAGDRWRTHQVTTLELPQIRLTTTTYKSGHIVDMRQPQEWSLDPTWLLVRMVGR